MFCQNFCHRQDHWGGSCRSLQRSLFLCRLSLFSQPGSNVFLLPMSIYVIEDFTDSPPPQPPTTGPFFSDTSLFQRRVFKAQFETKQGDFDQRLNSTRRWLFSQCGEGSPRLCRHVCVISLFRGGKKRWIFWSPRVSHLVSVLGQFLLFSSLSMCLSLWSAVGFGEVHKQLFHEVKISISFMVCLWAI